VVGVEEPEIHLDARPPNPWRAVPGAIELVNALRASGRFARVDFQRQLGCEPDLVLVPIENPDPGYHNGNDPDDTWLLLGLGVVPVIESFDRGHYFARRGTPDPAYAFPWERVEVLWWGSGPLALLPGWQFGRAPERSREAFAAFLDQHWSALFGGVTPRRDPKCLSSS
jgi:hypothetical protein